MTIFEVLKDDHKKVRNILEQLETTSVHAVSRRQALVNKLWDELVPHERAEEKVLYDVLCEYDGVRETGRKAYEEHRVNEGMLRELSLMDPAGDRFHALLEILKENIEHHIEEEETKVFDEAKVILADEEVRVMADVFIDLRNEVAETSMSEVSFETPRYPELYPQGAGIRP
jgi:hypothetical protein